MTDVPSDEAKGVEIWTPPETLDANVQRMAWLLFLETWKRHLVVSDCNVEMIEERDVEKSYNYCLMAAKIVRKLEQAPQ